MYTFNRLKPFLLFLIALCISTSIYSQRSISFKTGNFPLLPPRQDVRQGNSTQYLFYQADHVLTTNEKEILKQQGIEILYALHDHIYWVRVTKSLNDEMARNFFDLNPAYKVATDMTDRSQSGRLRLSIAPGMSKAIIEAWAIENEITLLDSRAYVYGLIDVQASESSIERLINTPWISFIGRLPIDEEINYRADHGERGRGLTSPLTRDLDGEGITVGIGDGGRLGVHADLSVSILDLSSFAFSSHATHVSGIITGAGMIDPFYGHGHAPKANIILRNFSDILWDTPQYIQDYGLSLTNNSYGTSLGDCTYFGDYDGTSAGLDAMITSHPQLLHVFAAANSGGMTCSPYPAQFATLAGGYQPAKNVLTVGAVNNADANAGFSSRGPADDGRIKPEIVAYGVDRYSTNNNHTYGSGNGTSFSSPGATGIATLLYQRYKELHNDSLPDAALIKNVMCNAADDLGNAGPDYIYGFGRVNGVRSVEILESGHYVSVNVDHGNTLTKVISVPSGAAFVDVMLLWTDVASAPFETVTLVNDLDIVVIKPNGDTLKPWKMNYTPSGVNLPAGTGTDHINNYEQVTIPTPVSGDYTVVIKGYEVPMGPQKAWLSWDVCLAGITMQGPIGGEVYKPGNINVPSDRQYIRWDAFGTGSSTFTAEYSTNGGSTWNTIASGIQANRRYQEWFPPNSPTDQLKVKVTATNGMADTSDQHAVIMAAPAGLLATTPCNGYVQVNWSAVTGATYYRIFTIRNETLTAIDTTSGTSIILGDFPHDSAVWVTVCGVFASGVNGLRARAVTITANGGNNCAWDHDLRLDSIVALTSGRIQTSSALTANEPITIRITNAGTMSAAGFSLSYSINDVFVSSEVFSGTLNPGSGQDFTFSDSANLAATDAYTIKVWTSYLSDPLHQNDTLMKQIHHLPNPVVSLPWSESFESCPDTMIISNLIGLPALNAWDAYLQPNARIRTFAGDTFCYAGNNALTVDAIRSGTNKTADLVLTLNMSSWSVDEDDIRLNLYVMHHEFTPDGTNNEAIWIRGSDTSDFVLLINMSNDPTLRGKWQYLAGLNLTDALTAAGQDFSSSFQLKFTHGVYATAGQLTSEDGQTIDGLSIHVVHRDITISDMLHPGPLTCDSGMDTISISITNTSSQDVTNTRAYYRLDGGATYSTLVGTVPAMGTINALLLPPLDIPASGIHHLEVWVYSADDDFHFNDTIATQVLQTPFVNSFPYT
ncbi:MAG TPA: S8 family serine peptidase, partial [Saprospiraceae bacterium]|nr:S8 family serine peptidase [Saprospiraceae bacterium]